MTDPVPHRVRILSYVATTPGATAFHIATALGLPTSSVSSLLTKMRNHKKVYSKPGRELWNGRQEGRRYFPVRP